MDSVVCIEGRIRYDEFNKRVSVNVDNAMSLDEFRSSTAIALCVELAKSDQFRCNDFLSVVKSYSRDDGLSLVIKIMLEDCEGKIYLPFSIFDVDSFKAKILNIVGVKNVFVEY